MERLSKKKKRRRCNSKLNHLLPGFSASLQLILWVNKHIHFQHKALVVIVTVQYISIIQLAWIFDKQELTTNALNQNEFIVCHGNLSVDFHWSNILLELPEGFSSVFAKMPKFRENTSSGLSFFGNAALCLLSRIYSHWHG